MLTPIAATKLTRFFLQKHSNIIRPRTQCKIQWPWTVPPSPSAEFGFRNCKRNISISLILQKNLPPRPKINENDIEETFLKGSGPGGQKINKTNSAVQLKHVPTGIVVKSQATRSRDQNRTIARKLLAEKLDQLDKGDMSRMEIKRRDEAKKKDRKKRKSKAKYLKLEEEKEKKEQEEEGREEGEEGEEEESHVKDGLVIEKVEIYGDSHLSHRDVRYEERNRNSDELERGNVGMERVKRGDSKEMLEKEEHADISSVEDVEENAQPNKEKTEI